MKNYMKFINYSNLIIIFGIAIVLGIAVIIKMSGVLEGFGDLTAENIGPLTRETRITKATWMGIKDKVFNKEVDPDLQARLGNEWKNFITEREGLYYAEHGRFPYPEAIKECFIQGEEKQVREEKNKDFTKKERSKAMQELSYFEKSLPVRMFVLRAPMNMNPCVNKIPELKVIEKLLDSSSGVLTKDNRKLNCGLGAQSDELRAYKIQRDMNGREVKADPHTVGIEELPELVPEIHFLNKPCNPCDDMVNCKFGVNKKVSNVASMWWGINSASNSQIV